MLAATLAATACACLAPPLASAVEALETPSSASAPQLTGTPAVGQTLACSPGAWTGSPTSYSYAWLRDGAPISGQTGSSYVVETADEGHAISCAVRATSSDGAYTITSLPTGPYALNFRAGAEEGGNYQPQIYDKRSILENFSPVLVTAPNATRGIDAALTEGGEITGRLTSAVGGAAAAGVFLCAEEESAGYDECGESDNAGEYTLSGLIPGSYVVSVLLGPGEQNPYVGARYRSSVPVNAGEVSSGIDFSLTVGGRIVGTVTAAGTGDPIPRIEVCATPTSSGEGPCVYTDEAGRYTMSGLAKNGYVLEFSGNRREGETTANFISQSRPELEVEAGKSYDEDATLQVGGQIAGKLLSAGGAPVPGVYACAGRYCTTTGSDGSYTISGLPSGTYEVTFERGPEKASVAGIEVTAGETAAAPNATMPPGGQITGTVTSAATGAPVSSVEVCARDVMTYTYCTSTGADGKYTLSQLPESEYKLTFEPEAGTGETLQYYGGTTEANATVIPVALEHSVTSIDVALATGGEISGRVTSAATGEGIAGVRVCAQLQEEEAYDYGCATTTKGGTSAAVASNALAVPAAAPTPAPKPEASSGFLIEAKRFNRKSGKLEVTLKTSDEGVLSWTLSFKSADVGLSAALGVERALPLAGADRHRRGRHAKCRSGFVKRSGRCLRREVTFAAGHRRLAQGAVLVKIALTSKARKALRSGHLLHVSGSLVFQSALGGSPARRKISFLARPTPARHHKKKKKKRRA